MNTEQLDNLSIKEKKEVIQYLSHQLPREGDSVTLLNTIFESEDVLSLLYDALRFAKNRSAFSHQCPNLEGKDPIEFLSKKITENLNKLKLSRIYSELEVLRLNPKEDLKALATKLRELEKIANER